ncbi:hypothetical protein JCM8208_007798 [Rhodotorula glutinis]
MTPTLAVGASPFALDRLGKATNRALPDSALIALLALASLVPLGVPTIPVLFHNTRHADLVARLGQFLVIVLGLDEPFAVNEVPPGLPRCARPGGGGGGLFVDGLRKLLGPVSSRLARAGRRRDHRNRVRRISSRPTSSFSLVRVPRSLGGHRTGALSTRVVVLLGLSFLPSVMGANPSTVSAAGASGSSARAVAGVAVAVGAAALGAVAASAGLARRKNDELSSSPPQPPRKRLRRSNGEPVKRLSELEDGAEAIKDDSSARVPAPPRARSDTTPYLVLGSDDDDDDLPDPRLFGRARPLETDRKATDKPGYTSSRVPDAPVGRAGGSSKGKGKASSQDENSPRSPARRAAPKSNLSTAHGPLGATSSSAAGRSSTRAVPSSAPALVPATTTSRPVPTRGLSGVSAAPSGRAAPMVARTGTADYASPVAAASRATTRPPATVDKAPPSAVTATLRAEIAGVIEQGAPVVPADPLGEAPIVDYLWRITSTPSTRDPDGELAQFGTYLDSSAVAQDVQARARKAKSFLWLRTGSAQQPVGSWNEESWARSASASGLARRLAAGRVSVLLSMGVTSLGVNFDSLEQVYDRMSPGATVVFLRHDSTEVSQSLLITPGTVLPFLRLFASALSADPRLSVDAPVTFDAVASVAAACAEYGTIADELVAFAGGGPLADTAEYLRSLVLSLGRRLLQQTAAHLDLVDRHRRLNVSDDETSNPKHDSHISPAQTDDFDKGTGKTRALEVPSGLFGRQGVIRPLCDRCKTKRESVEYSTGRGTTTRMCKPCLMAEERGDHRGAWDEELLARRRARHDHLCVNPKCDRPEGSGTPPLLVHRSDGGVRCHPCYDFIVNHADQPGRERDPHPYCVDCDQPMRFDSDVTWKLLGPDVGPGVIYKRRSRHLQLCSSHYNDLFDRKGPPPSSCADCRRVMNEGEKHGSTSKNGQRQCRACSNFERSFGHPYDPARDDFSCCSTSKVGDFVIRASKDGYYFLVCIFHESRVARNTSSVFEHDYPLVRKPEPNKKTKKDGQ